MTQIEYVLNISINVFINITFFEILYKVKFRDFLNLITSKRKKINNINGFLKIKQEIKNNVNDVIKFT